MRRRKRVGIGIGAALAVGAIALVVAAPAGAHKVAFDTNLQLKLDKVNDTTEQYSGKVTSTKARCVRFRTINVFQSGTLIGSTVSNFVGDWVVTGPVPPSTAEITAFAPRKILKRNAKHRHKCKAAQTSRKVPGN